MPLCQIGIIKTIKYYKIAINTKMPDGFPSGDLIT